VEMTKVKCKYWIPVCAGMTGKIWNNKGKSGNETI